MAAIDSYPVDGTISNDDIVVGSNADNSNVTVNYKIGDISDFTRGNTVLSDVTSVTSQELSILSGATLNTAQLNILTGATLSTSELNILDGALLTTQELNFVDGVTSSIQTQINTKTSEIETNATDIATNVAEIAAIEAGRNDFTSDITITEETPQIQLYNTREAGDNRELGGIRWNSDDDASTSRLFGRITFESTDISNESIDSTFLIRGIQNDVFRDYLNIGPNSTAIGRNAAASDSSVSVALGAGSSATGLNSIAIGSNASATGNVSVAIGSGASATFTNQIKLGTTNSYVDILGYIIIEQGATIRANSVLGTDADSFLTVNSGTINFANLPTASTGLATGDLWNDSGTLKIV